MVTRPAALAETAAAAARATSVLSKAADQIHAYIPLGAYPRPLHELYESAEYLGNCLRYAAPVASRALDLDPAAQEAGEPPAVSRRLIEARDRTRRARDTIGQGGRSLLRNLDQADERYGAGSADAEALTLYAKRAATCLAALQTDLMKARKPHPGLAPAALTEAADITMSLALAVTFTGQACERFAYGLTGAYKQHRAGQGPVTPRPPMLLTLAGTMLLPVAAETRRAYRALDDAADRARKAARQAAG
jgi:hypothetical protein